jgi:hypothetical protein
MKTIDEIAAELVKRGPDADLAAVVMIRCLDYDSDLTLDAEAYRTAVRTILDGLDRAREVASAELAATLASLREDLTSLREGATR